MSQYSKDFPKMFQPKENNNMALNLTALNIDDLKAELDKALPILVDAATVAERFAAVLDPSLAPALEAGIRVLTVLESILEKA